MNALNLPEVKDDEHVYKIEPGPGESLVLADLARELARPRAIRHGGVRHARQSVGRLLRSSGDDEVCIVVSSSWPSAIVHAAMDSYVTVRTLVGRIDNSLTASRTLIVDLVREPMCDRACARLDRDWRAEHHALTALIERSDIFGSVAAAYKARSALLRAYLNLLYQATRGRYGVDPRPDSTASSESGPAPNKPFASPK